MARPRDFCQVCDTEFVADVRDPFMFTMSDLVDGWNVLSKLYRTKLLVSEIHLKRFASWLEEMYYTRRNILYI